MRSTRRVLTILASLVLLAPAVTAAQDAPARATQDTSGPVRRMPDGKPDLQGYYSPDSRGANYGLGPHAPVFGLPGGPGFIIDPPDQQLPLQPWAATEQKSRALAERGYDDPTAHCFVAGIPRSMYTSSFHILQPPGHVIFLFERISHRSVPLDGRVHLPDRLRLWQGDSVGRWEGDTLIIETQNLNGKAWLNEIGEVISYAAKVTERFTPVDAGTIDYQATVSDLQVYTRPWTIGYKLRRSEEELLEVACHEDNQDLEHLKNVRDAARAGTNK